MSSSSQTSRQSCKSQTVLYVLLQQMPPQISKDMPLCDKSYLFEGSLSRYESDQEALKSRSQSYPVSTCRYSGRELGKFQNITKMRNNLNLEEFNLLELFDTKNWIILLTPTLRLTQKKLVKEGYQFQFQIQRKEETGTKRPGEASALQTFIKRQTWLLLFIVLNPIKDP